MLFRSDPGYAGAIMTLAREHGAAAVVPQASADLPGLAAAREDFAAAGIVAIVSSPEAVARADSKLATMTCATEAGVRVPEHRVAVGADALVAAAHALGYPGRDVCVKPVVSAGSRGFHVLSAAIDRRAQLLTARPGPAPLSLEDAAAALGDDPTELLVMELVTGRERTVDGYARGGEVLFAHAKTREELRAGLAMRFVALDDPAQVASAVASGSPNHCASSSPSVHAANTRSDGAGNVRVRSIPGRIRAPAAYACCRACSASRTTDRGTRRRRGRTSGAARRRPRA